MDKYSRKIVNFLDNYVKDNISIDNNINDNHELIKHLKKIASEILSKQINYVPTLININQIDNDKYPKLYYLFKGTYPEFNKFLLWYNENQQDINCIEYQNNPVYDLIFNQKFII